MKKVLFSNLFFRTQYLTSKPLTKKSKIESKNSQLMSLKVLIGPSNRQLEDSVSLSKTTKEKNGILFLMPKLILK